MTYSLPWVPYKSSTWINPVKPQTMIIAHPQRCELVSLLWRTARSYAHVFGTMKEPDLFLFQTSFPTSLVVQYNKLFGVSEVR